MRRRTLRTQVVAGAVVAALLAVALPVVYVALLKGTASVRAGEGVRASQAGLVALVAVVVGIVAVATYTHWLMVTERPREPRPRHVPSRLEVALAGVAVIALCAGAWPILSLVYLRAVDAVRASDLSWAVAYGLVGVVYLWFVVVAVHHYLPWARRRG